jgi:hypothetical protein
MPTPPTPPIWTLNASGITPPGSDGALLAGCHITTNAAGTNYEFTQPNINNVLATTPGTSLPSIPFQFPTTGVYQGFEWTIYVTSLPSGANGGGQWSIVPVGELSDHPKDPTGPTSGDFTAQSGSGVGEDEAAAHSAKAQ